MEFIDSSFYDDYRVSNETEDGPLEPESLPLDSVGLPSGLSEALMTINVGICLLGLCGNGLVIWISGFRMKRTVNTTWYLSLAVSDFIYCSFLPFNITTMADVGWPFGLLMCKLASLVLLLNMFSSIFLLVLVSVDRCLMVAFPVWSLNHRTLRKASISVLVAWVTSAALSIPALAFRQVKANGSVMVCYTDYGDSQGIIALSRFLCGFVVPFLVIITCYSFIIKKLWSKRATKSSKPFRVMSALIVAFFLCWFPYHVFVLLQLNHGIFSYRVIKTGLMVGSTIASANSFLNPVLYVLVGHDFRKKLKSSLLLQIEDAVREESQTHSRTLSRRISVPEGQARVI
uniref:Chemerin chemokine-like receptor 1 n=1 Tax=Paramormyrops kingsleyae TaxID=1676925 RepID=A0A3B3TCX0_9TELE|nr:chemokine-like receptor 1 [Paramormyrops kingsleyae]